MILFTLAGFAAHTWLGWQSGVVIGLLAGFVVASLVPSKAACAVPRAPDPADVPGGPDA